MSRPGDWNCKTCSHLNFQRRESCQRCGEPRTGGGGGVEFGMGGAFGGRGGGGGGSSPFASFTTGPDVRPGDWYCTLGNCGAHNFASRSSCFKCGAPKEDSSADASSIDITRMRPYAAFGGGGGGGASTRPCWKSGDWICTRSGCNEHNFANRMECYRCNAPRDSSSSSGTGRSSYLS